MADLMIGELARQAGVSVSLIRHIEQGVTEDTRLETARKLAIALRVPATRIGAIIKSERSVTADTALRLARFFGTSPEFWMSMQAMHDLTRARRESG